MKTSIYQKKLDDLLAELNVKKSSESDNYKKPTLLLHACCGPCSSYVIEYLSFFFDITILYYNPNIYPAEEYWRRLNELKDLLPRFSPAVLNNVHLVEDTYNQDDFFNAIDVRNAPELAKEAEKGERCRRCYKFRLERAFKYAQENNFDYFCTTLSISPFKDAEKINTIGIQLEKENNTGKGPLWLFSDFKKKGGFKRSLELSAEYGLYRQQYCGCIYSKNSREEFDERRKTEHV